jgi:hypothetical protein
MPLYHVDGRAARYGGAGGHVVGAQSVVGHPASEVPSWQVDEGAWAVWAALRGMH